MSELPAATRRLFDGYDPDVLDAAGARDFVIERLLESGESADLCWLVRARADEAAVRTWFERHGGRRLSRRSRAFWSLVLGAQPSDTSPLGREIWDV